MFSLHLWRNAWAQAIMVLKVLIALLELIRIFF
ncbi:TPA: damage-inducible type I toxin DinQ [Citrobacter freundii]